MSADDFFDESNIEDGDSEAPGEEYLCPICYDSLDITDMSFKPCPCGFQTCRFCWNHINENMNGKCPACRTPYSAENYTFTPPDPAKLQKAQQISRGSKDKARRRREDVSARRRLQDLRVIQRNLVYVTNIALEVAKEEILKRFDYFGQYGKVIKLVVNRSHVYQGVSVSCYATYAKPEDAFRCIDAVDGAELHGRTLHASFGTTKYCSNFMKARPCNNPECMYLHELGDDKDSFTKEDMQAGKHIIRNQEQAAQIIALLASPSCPKPPRKVGVIPKLPAPREDWSSMLQRHNAGSLPFVYSMPDDPQGGSSWKTQSLGVPAPSTPSDSSTQSGWKTQSQVILPPSSKGRSGPAQTPKTEEPSDEQPVVPAASAKKSARQVDVESHHSQAGHHSAHAPKAVWKTKSQPAKPSPVQVDETDFPPPQVTKSMKPPPSPQQAVQPASTEVQENTATKPTGGVWKVVPAPAPVSIQAELQKSEELRKQDTKPKSSSAKGASTVLPSSASWASRSPKGRAEYSQGDDGNSSLAPDESEVDNISATNDTAENNDTQPKLTPPFSLPPPIPGLSPLDPAMLASPEALTEWLRVASEILRKEIPDDPNDLAAVILAASMPLNLPQTGPVPGSMSPIAKHNSRFQFARADGNMDEEPEQRGDNDKRNSLRALLPNVSITFSETPQPPPPGTVKQPPGLLPGAPQPLLWTAPMAPQGWRQDPRFPVAPNARPPADFSPVAPGAAPAIWGPNVSDQALFQLLTMPQAPGFGWVPPPGFDNVRPNSAQNKK